MRHTNYFDHFLAETVNLDQGRLDRLEQSVGAVYRALAADDVLGPWIVDKVPQGSWAYRTIIKPPGKKEFDADFLLVMGVHPDWEPAEYVENVYAALHRNGRYNGMPHNRHCRCVRVVYEADYHIDIVPQTTLADGRLVIPNRDENKWEDSNPKAFADWFNGRDEVAGGNLRKAVRIVKFLRDHKGTFAGTPSVILTTLLGNQVTASRMFADPLCYEDVPTTLLTVIEDLDGYLQQHETKPTVEDPSGTGLNFDHRWEQPTYANFRDRIHGYAEKMWAAYDEPDRDRSVELWQDLFGLGFTAPPAKSAAGRYGSSAAAAASVVTSGRAG